MGLRYVVNPFWDACGRRLVRRTGGVSVLFGLVLVLFWLSLRRMSRPAGFLRRFTDFIFLRFMISKIIQDAAQSGVVLRLIFDRRNQAATTGRGVVEVEMSGSGFRRRLSTGVSVNPRQWDGGRVIHHPDADELNRRIDMKVAALRDAADAGDPRGESVVQLGAMARQNSSPVEWIRERIAARNIADHTRAMHYALADELEASGMFERWSDFTPRTLALWEARLRRVRNIKKQSSVYDWHKRLKVYCEEAVLMGRLKDNPYKRFKTPKGRPEDTIKFITDDQREAIAALTLEAGSGAARARDMFLLACFTGLAYCDMVKLSRDDIRDEGGRRTIIDRRCKTGTPYHITLLRDAEAILERYDYNMNLLSNQKLNAYLKGIGAAVGVAGLTMHMGRHTFATWALKSGVPIEIVSKMLAHSDIATTQVYAKVLQSEVDRGFDLLRQLRDGGM